MTAVPASFSPYLSPNFAASMLVALDVPPLSNSALALGCYFGAMPFSPGVGTWNGTVVFWTPDGGSTWLGQAPIIGKEMTLGYAVTALGNWPGGFTLDTTNVVQVQLTDPALALSSVTMAQLMAGANLALLGGELIQFQNATLVSAGVYNLSILIRGLQGSERFIATHAIGEQFVLVDPAALVDIGFETTQLQSAQTYVGVTNGAKLQTSWLPPANFTFTGNRHKPLSPVQAAAYKLSTNDIVINWVRRARVNNQWANFTDVPLDEAAEAYRVDILSGSVVKRSITAGVATVTYTSAQQTTDFGAPVSSLVANIYQISSVVGDGWPNSFSWP